MTSSSIKDDPLSPSVFILSIDILLKILKRARSLSLIEGIGARKEFNNILSSQFVDDILLFCAAKE